jgi:hypothetical protein
MEAEWSRQVGTPTSPKVLEQRLSIKIHRILVEFPHSSKLEPRDPVEPWRISTELPLLSYEEGSRQARRPSSPRSLATLPTRLHLATTLWTRALQVELPNNGVWLFWFPPKGVFIRPWASSIDLAEVVTHQVLASRPSHVAGQSDWMASTAFLHQLGLPLLV